MERGRIGQNPLRHGGDDQRPATGGGGTENRLRRECDHRRRVFADTQLYEEVPIAIWLQRLLRDIRPCPKQGWHHHLEI